MNLPSPKIQGSDEARRCGIEHRLAAIEPFYVAYAMEVLPRSSTLYAVYCEETRLTRIGSARRFDRCQRVFSAGQDTCPRLVATMPVHPALVGTVEHAVHDVFAEHRLYGRWFDLAPIDPDELTFQFGEVNYLELVFAHLAALLPRDTRSEVGSRSWLQAMDEQLHTVETWLAGIKAQCFEHDHTGVVRLSFRAGRPPLAEYFEPWLAAFSGSTLFADSSEGLPPSSGANPQQQKTG